MAYNKRTWLGRQGTGLNKFSIGGATPVTIVNQPDSVTQVGDALSAGNLNDLEDRIEDAFDDVDTALDTKADEQDVTNLNNAITQLDHRLDNLEQAKGSYDVQNYKDGSITPSGKGAWSIVEGLRGVSRVENNLVQNPSFESGVLSPWTIVGGNATVNNNKVVVTSASLCALYQSIQIQKGHIYLLAVDIDSNNTNLTFGIYKDSSGYKVTTAFTGKKMLVLANIDGDVDGHNIDLRIRVNDSNSTTYTASNFIVKDLTLYFGGTIPSDADTIAEIQTNYPHLLTPSEYGQRIVDSSYTGVRGFSINIWDEEWESGKYNLSTGAKQDSAGQIRSKNFISVEPSTQYYFGNAGASTIIHNVYFFDANKNFISADGWYSNSAFTTQSGCYYITFDMSSSYGTTYNNDIQICLNSATDKAIYHPHILDTLSLTFQGKSAGSVYDSCEPNVEVGGVAKKRNVQRIGSVDMATLAWSYNSTYDCYTYTLSDYSGTDGAYICANYANGGARTIENMASVPKGIYNWGKRLQVKDSASPTGILYFALLNPIVTLSDPIIDNTLLTEAGGRMATVQTGTVVDGSFDLGFINL